MKSSLSLLVICLTSLLHASTASAALPLPPEKEKWVKVSVGEFHIYSNAGERETRELATNLVRMQTAVGKVTRLAVRSTLPMNVFLFRDERSFAPYRDAIFQKVNTNASGAFLPSRDENFVVLENAPEGGTEKIIYHELTHYFVNNTLSGVPLWFHEGIAEFYSTFSASGSSALIGKPVPQHVNWLREGHVMPVDQLFAVNTRSPEYNETSRQGVFYAQSWALMHYLLVGSEERKPQLPKYLSLIRSGKTIDEAFRSAFQTSYADLERELRGYLRKPAFSYIGYSFEELAIPEIPKPLPASRDEVLFALGNLLAHTNAATLPDATTFLTEAARLNPANAAAHAILGYLHEKRGDRAAATAAYETAIATGSQDSRVFVSYGATILDRMFRSASSGPGSVPVAEVAKVRDLFNKAVTLDPGSTRGWAGLGATYLFATGKDLQPGITALETSLKLAASQEDVAFNLVQLYARAGRRADAQRVHDAVLARSSDPQRVRQGQEAVLTADVRAAEDHLQAGRMTEGIVIMRDVAARTTDNGLKEYLQRTIASAENHALRESQTAAVNAAITKAKDGKYAEALEMVDAVLPQITDPEMKAQVVKLRGELAKATGVRK